MELILQLRLCRNSVLALASFEFVSSVESVILRAIDQADRWSMVFCEIYFKSCEQVGVDEILLSHYLKKTQQAFCPPKDRLQVMGYGPRRFGSRAQENFT
jgi:hypothetical protein